MGLAEDLLEQARHLAALDKTKPKQANLRRAVSSAYYAVFHLLVANAAMKLSPTKPQGLVPRISRTFSHTEMKSACRNFANTPSEPIALLLNSPVSSKMSSLAEYFIELQEARHKADYDTGVGFSRTNVSALLDKATSCFRLWQTAHNTDEANVFLAALAFGARWSK